MSDGTSRQGLAPTESLADLVWKLWEEGQRPDVHALLQQAGPLPPGQIAEVLRVDQRQRWEAHECIQAEEYLQDYPELRQDPDAAVDLIYSEFLVRERHGEQPDPAEFLQRFPEYASILQSQIDLHLAMADIDDSGCATYSKTSLADAEPGHNLEMKTPRISGYEILEELGRGGMGIVYKALDLRLKRVVALKMLLAGAQADAEHLARFRIEAEAVARLQHRNIVQIYEVGETEGRPYLVLEYVQGGNLKRRLSGTPLPARESAGIVETLAHALQFAHEQGVLHRDLKPANILLAGDNLPGEPKVADFGLAKLLEGESPGGASVQATQSGTMLGTPSYMAPEQAAGRCKSLGPAVDIYALGAILYELLTGRPPFQGESPIETLHQVILQDPVPPSRLRVIPLDLDTICMKCLEKDPGRRYASAGGFAEDLRRFQAGEPITARPIGVWERVWRWSRRNPRWAMAIGAIASLLLVITVGASLWSLDRSAALARVRQAESEAARQLYESRLSEARAHSLSRRPGQRFKSLAILDLATEQARELKLPPSHFRELRQATLAALVVPDLSPMPTAARSPSGTAEVDFNDRLEIYARCDAAGHCSIRRVDNDEELYLLRHAGSWPWLSRDARFVAVKTPEGTTSVWRLYQGKHHKLFTTKNVYWLDFDTRSQRIAFAHADGAISLHDLNCGKRLQLLLPAGLSKQIVIALHPTESLVAAASYFEREVQIRNLATGAMETRLDMPGGCSDLAWHPSGQWLAASDGNGPNIHVFDRAAFQRKQQLGPVAGGARLFFNHAGDRLAVHTWIGSVQLFDFATGQVLLELPSARALIHLRFSRDDGRLAGFLEDDRLGIWQVADGREYRTLARQSAGTNLPYASPAVSSNGRWLAMGMADSVILWDLHTGTPVAFLPLNAAFVQFSPDGDLLTGGSTGTYRWPIQGRAAGGYRVGPPRALALPPGGSMAQSSDGRVLAVRARDARWETSFAGAWVLRADSETPLHLDPGADIGHIAMSPDGRHVVTSEYNMGPVKIWEANTGRLERLLMESGGGPVHFSPDGRWLVVSGKNSRIFSRLDWEEKYKLTGSAVFAPDRRTLAVGAGNHTLDLVDLFTGRQLARLEDPNMHVCDMCVFTPDGARIVTVDPQKGAHVWDLRALRQALAQRGLDWDAPPYAPAVTAERTSQFHVDMGDYPSLSQRTLARNLDLAVQAAPHRPERWYRRNHFHQDVGNYAAAKKDLQKTVELSPAFSQACNDLAWLCATGPENVRDALQAVSLARRAVKQEHNNWAYWNTLGVAYYRAGRWRDAVQALEKSLHGAAGQADAYDLYFLAMCHSRLGDTDRAGACFTRACSWQDQQAPRLSKGQLDELNRFRAEAESTLRRKKAR